MQKLAEICIRRPVFAAMIILALVVVGAASYGRLGVDRFPSVDLPTVTVRTNLPGASTEEMETEVSQKIEEAVNTVEGIEELRSVSSAGSSFLIVTFSLEPSSVGLFRQTCVNDASPQRHFKGLTTSSRPIFDSATSMARGRSFSNASNSSA